MDEIVVLDNFIDTATCENMVEFYNREFIVKNPIHDGRKIFKNPTQPEAIAFLETYLPQLRTQLGGNYFIREVFLSLYEKGSFAHPHLDSTAEELKDSLVVLFYFNEDYEGGEIYFTKLNKQIKPKKSQVIYFPCNQPLYEHGVFKILDGKRYILLMELTLNENLKVYDI
jgi:hypothetical protein